MQYFSLPRFRQSQKESLFDLLTIPRDIPLRRVVKSSSSGSEQSDTSSSSSLLISPELHSTAKSSLITQPYFYTILLSFATDLNLQYSYYYST